MLLKLIYQGWWRVKRRLLLIYGLVLPFLSLILFMQFMQPLKHKYNFWDVMGWVKKWQSVYIIVFFIGSGEEDEVRWVGWWRK